MTLLVILLSQESAQYSRIVRDLAAIDATLTEDKIP